MNYCDLRKVRRAAEYVFQQPEHKRSVRRHLRFDGRIVFEANGIQYFAPSPSPSELVDHMYERVTSPLGQARSRLGLSGSEMCDVFGIESRLSSILVECASTHLSAREQLALIRFLEERARFIIGNRSVNTEEMEGDDA